MFFFFSSRRRHTRSDRDWSSDVCSSDLAGGRPRPRRSGDGGFSMLMAEFLTAIQHNLPVKIVINNNNSLGQILWEQMVLGYPEHGVRYPQPPVNYAALATANGGFGIKVTGARQGRRPSRPRCSKTRSSSSSRSRRTDSWHAPAPVLCPERVADLPQVRARHDGGDQLEQPQQQPARSPGDPQMARERPVQHVGQVEDEQEDARRPAQVTACAPPPGQRQPVKAGEHQTRRSRQRIVLRHPDQPHRRSGQAGQRPFAGQREHKAPARRPRPGLGPGARPGAHAQASRPDGWAMSPVSSKAPSTSTPIVGSHADVFFRASPYDHGWLASTRPRKWRLPGVSPGKQFDPDSAGKAQMHHEDVVSGGTYRNGDSQRAARPRQRLVEQVRSWAGPARRVLGGRADRRTTARRTGTPRMPQ